MVWIFAWFNNVVQDGKKFMEHLMKQCKEFSCFCALMSYIFYAGVLMHSKTDSTLVGLGPLRKQFH